ncbi:MAG: heavy metal translocating P-type ATPase [Phycisphaerae bacterium]|nr:heavy metal translocating P-type ATPase [Phycisphaerae bacterium]
MSSVAVVHQATHDHSPSPAGRKYSAFASPAISATALIVGFAAEKLGASTWTVLPFYGVSFVVAGVTPAVEGFRQLFRLRLDIDFLMVIAAIGAAIVGEFAEGCLLLVLFSIGHALEHHAMGQAHSAIAALGALAPRTARRRSGGVEVEVSVEDLAVGDVVVVRPAERLAADGVVIEGESDVDQSPITGESVPVAKSPGGGVFAGTLNGDGGLVIQVRKLASESTMARMARMVAEAESQKAPTQRLAERFTRVYVPCVVIATILVAVIPPQMGWLAGRDAFLRAMTLLVGASPCALGLSTPAAILAAVARAARQGVLIKGGAHLERLGTVVAIAMDKTGTITLGKPTVTDVIAIEGDEAELLGVAASVEALSTHPLARAIVAAAAERGIAPDPATAPVQRPGKGMLAIVHGRRVTLGSVRAFDGVNAPKPPASVLTAIHTLESSARTVVVIEREGRFLGIIGLADRPRPEAKESFARLRALGIRAVVMLTGDNRRVAEAIGNEVGVDRIEAELMPEQKIAHVHALERELGPIAMIGDGVNDAPALASATVGIAMGAGGTDVALEAADVALMNDDLGKLPFAIGLSRAARRIIFQNVGIAMGVVLVLVILASFGMVPMPIAVVLHEGSTVVVVLNALRLLRYTAT